MSLTTHASKQGHLDKLQIFSHSEANDTVQPRAVNLAYAEPCQNQGTALFFAGPIARNPSLWRTRMRAKRLSRLSARGKVAPLRPIQW
jgi:hypothetical protein